MPDRIGRSPLTELASLAAIRHVDDRRAEMSTEIEGAAVAPDTGAPSTPWALGDYHRFSKETIWQCGPVLVEACGIGPGQRVLDVAAGTGNVAIRAAEAGADVVASDLTPENFPAGRREATEHGVELEWVTGDAQDLPFPDASFDVVTSAFGAIFAPDHRAVADELVRVCRPGGAIGLLAFTPDGLLGDFFAALAPHSPPPPEDALPPTLWGDQTYLAGLFGDRVELRYEQRSYVERAEDPAAYVRFFRETFGPVVATYDALADDPAGTAALDRDFLAFAERCNTGPAGGPAEYRYDYLVVVGTRR